MSTVASARYTPHDSAHALHLSDANRDKTAVRRDSASSTTKKSFSAPSPANMNDDLNPQAMPFRPGGPTNNDHRPWNQNPNQHNFHHNHNHNHNHIQNRNYGYNHNENYAPPPPPPPPMMPSYGPGGAPWNSNYGHPPMPPPPPPPPPPHFFTNNHHPPHNQYAAQEQARAHHYHMAQQNGHPGYRNPPHPYGPPPPMPPQQHHYPNQNRPFPPQPQFFDQQRFPHPAYPSPMQQAKGFMGASTEELQAPALPAKKSKKAKAKAKAAANGEVAQNDTSQPGKASKKGRYGDEKIMLPAPQPTDLYLNQALEEPSAVETTGHLLVILDLNGTVLYRPNRNAKTMIARPFLKQFLRYLFDNFKVMIWSSARPVNVKALVEQSLDKDLRSKLVATWARDTFGLSATNFNQNVQVYKNLRLIWSRDQIQQHHPEYAAGQRFGQHNTVLIDDSALKANAQPHNLLEIPEFEATSEQMEGDVLREVAGYLEVLRKQADVSKFINKEPFNSEGRWAYDWPADVPAVVATKSKASRKQKVAAPAAPLTDMTDSMSTVTLDASA